MWLALAPLLKFIIPAGAIFLGFCAYNAKLRNEGREEVRKEVREKVERQKREAREGAERLKLEYDKINEEDPEPPPPEEDDTEEERDEKLDEIFRNAKRRLSWIK